MRFIQTFCLPRATQLGVEGLIGIQKPPNLTRMKKANAVNIGLSH